MAKDVASNKGWVVKPVIPLVDGVIHASNAPHSEKVTAALMQAVLDQWEERPIYAGHPMIGGKPVASTANHGKTAIGVVRNARVEKDRFKADAWFDPTLAGPEMMARLASEEPIDISVGVFAETTPVPGNWNGRAYAAEWTSVIPDHLAILPIEERGACSWAMGCGVRAATGNGELRMLNRANFDDPEAAKPTTLKARLSQFLSDVLGENEIIALLGARNSATDLKRIQTMHDTAHDMHDKSMELGADCATKMAAAAAGHAADCDCHKNRELRAASTKVDEGGQNMHRNAERIKALIENQQSPWSAADQKYLEEATDDRLKELESHVTAQAAALKAAQDASAATVAASATKEAELKAATDKANADKLAAEKLAADNKAKTKTEAEFLAEAPQAIRDLVNRQKAQDEARRAVLTAALKAASEKEFTDEEFKTMPLEQLERFARLAQVEAPAEVNYAGQGASRHASETVAEPPDPWQAALDARAKGGR